MKAKTVVLTKRRKELIISFREEYKRNIPPGSDEWIFNLYIFMAQRDNQVKHADVMRWLRNHPWISSTPAVVNRNAEEQVANSPAGTDEENSPEMATTDEENSSETATTEEEHSSETATTNEENSSETASTDADNWSETATTGWTSPLPSNAPKRKQALDYHENKGPSTSKKPFQTLPDQVAVEVAVVNRREDRAGSNDSSSTISLKKWIRQTSVDHEDEQNKDSAVDTEGPPGQIPNLENAGVNRGHSRVLGKKEIPPQTPGCLHSSGPCFTSMLEEIQYPLEKRNDSPTSPAKFDNEDPHNLHKFSQAFVAVRYLTYMFCQNESLRTGLFYLNPIARLLTRVHLDVAVPMSYQEAHKTKKIKIKVEPVETPSFMTDVDLDGDTDTCPTPACTNENDENN